MHLMIIAKHRWKHCFINETKLNSIVLLDALKKIPLRWKLQLGQGFKLFKKAQKNIYIVSNLVLDVFN
jgi:hypothetical protein